MGIRVELSGRSVEISRSHLEIKAASFEVFAHRPRPGQLPAERWGFEKADSAQPWRSYYLWAFGWEMDVCVREPEPAQATA